MKKNTIYNIEACVGTTFYSPYFKEYIIVRRIVTKNKWFFSKESDPGDVIMANTPLTYFEGNPKLYDRRSLRPAIGDCQFYEDMNKIEKYKKILFIYIILITIFGIVPLFNFLMNLFIYVK